MSDDEFDLGDDDDELIPSRADDQGVEADWGTAPPPTGTLFCPECGTENPASAATCETCGRVVNPLAEADRATAPARKLHGNVVAVVAGICTVSVVFAWLLGLSLHLSVGEVLHFVEDEPVFTKVLAAEAKLSEVFGPALAFALAGAVAAGVFSGRYLREVVLGATAGIAAQFMIWMITIRLIDGELASELWISGEGFVMRGPAPILLTQLLLAMLFAAITMSFAGWIVREQITGKATCVFCDKPHSIRPQAPVRCPSCDVELERDGVQWPWVMLVALVSAIAFAAYVKFGREPLGFAFECHRQLSDACKAARNDDGFALFITQFDARDTVVWAVNQGRYIGYGAILMFAAPLGLTFLVKRGSRASAGALIPINWLLATFVILISLGEIGTSEAGFIFLMRMQVLALFAWGAAGVVGVLIGDRVRYSSGTAYLDELDD